MRIIYPKKHDINKPTVIASPTYFISINFSIEDTIKAIIVTAIINYLLF